MRFYEKWKNLHWCLLISVGYFSAFAKHLNADKQVAKRIANSYLVKMLENSDNYETKNKQ